MKKFLTALFFLIVLAGLCFFFGWAQMKVSPDTYGILRSKSHGMYPHLIKPGEFNWVWYKLIPANTKTTLFRITPVHRDFTAKNSLPFGTSYAAFIGMESDFSWEISASFFFSLNPEALIPLVTKNNISDQNELALYENEIAAQIESFILRRFDLNDEFAVQIEALLKYGKYSELEQEVYAEFPDIENFSISVKSSKTPNFALYRQAKELYDGYIARQKEFITNDIDEKAKNRAETFMYFNELELYGALLTKYPVLIEYLAIEKSKK